MTDQSFGRDARLSKREDFERVVAEGRKIVGRDLILWSRTREIPAPSAAPARPTARRIPAPGTAGEDVLPPCGARLGVSVSRKLGGAVRRNRLKRLLREAFRLNRSRLCGGYDLVAYPRPGCGWTGLAQAEDSFLKLCRRAGLVQELR